MKKIVITLITLLPIVAYGDNMCVKDGSILVVLDPQIAGTALSNNQEGKTWSTQFSYGVVSGIGGCYNDVGSTTGGVASDQVNITPYTTGSYCYCKMLKPVESAWVYSGLSNYYTSRCADNCASTCSSSTAGAAVALRAGMFGNIAE